MIDIFFHRPPTQDLFHPRVTVTTAPDSERAQTLIQLLNGAGYRAGGRPSDERRGSVAQLIARRDRALKREIAAILARKRPRPRAVVSNP